MIEKKYINLVADMVSNDDIAPIYTLEKKHNWICYFGETNPADILEELVSHLLNEHISNMVMITYTSMDDIKVYELDNISYELVFESYFMNQDKFETFCQYTILTTRDIDFICFKDSGDACFSLCGKYSLVQNSFSGLTYEKMMANFIQYFREFSISPLKEDSNDYWVKFLKVYDDFNKKQVEHSS